MSMEDSILSLAAWAAVLNGAATILSTISLIVFFAVGGVWGPISDGASVLWALSLLPLVLLLYGMHRPFASSLSLLVAAAGVGAILLFASLQSLLVVGVVSFEQTVGTVLALTGVIGIWLLVNGLLSLVALSLPSGLAWAAVVAGIAYLLSAVGFGLGGQEHPLAAVGFLVAAVAGPLWTFWLARLLANGHPALHLGGVS